MTAVIAILAFPPDYTWNKLQPRTPGHTYYRWLDWKWVDPLLVQTFEAGRHIFYLSHTLS